MKLRRTAVAAATFAAVAGLTGLPALPSAAAERQPTSASAVAADFPTGTVTTADGRTLFADRTGRTLQLRGFNVDKWDETTEADIRSIAAHGFTLVRVAISWNRLEPQRGRYDAAGMRRLQQLMGWADRYGLLALIDFHQDVYGPAFGGGTNGIPAWATRDDGLPFVADPNDWFAGYFQPGVMAAFTHLYDDADLRRYQTDFYTRVARALAGHRSLLGYDLFNEPSGPVAGDPSDPAAQVAASAALEQGRLASMYQRLIGAVRSVDSRSWLFVEPTVLVGEGVPTQLPGFADPRRGAARIGYAPHFYDTAVENGQDWDPADGFVDGYTAAITAYPRAHRLPVVVGEWGPPNSLTPGNTALIRQQVDAMEGFATGWTMWYWAKGSGGGYAVLGNDGKPLAGDAPAFAPYAAAVAGRPVSEGYDPATGRYTLVLTAGGGGWSPTRIVLPGTAYPAGARVSVSGGGRRSWVRAEQPVGDRAGAAFITLPAAHPGDTVTVTVSPR